MHVRVWICACVYLTPAADKVELGVGANHIKLLSSAHPHFLLYWLLVAKANLARPIS